MLTDGLLARKLILREGVPVTVESEPSSARVFRFLHEEPRAFG